MLQVVDIDRAVDPRDRAEREFLSRLAAHPHSHVLAWLHRSSQAQDVKRFSTGESQASGALAWHELQWENPHANEIAAMDSLEAFRDRCFYAQQQRPLRRPVSRATRPVLFA